MREGNLAYDDCLRRVSLSTVCALYVSCFARENKDGDKVRYPADAGNDAAIEARMEELEQAFLAAKRG